MSASGTGGSGAYDAAPYPEFTFPDTHPARLGAIARLFGLGAADPSRPRVLELGCASATNLLAMARSMPAGQFVGVDLSQVQIDAGNQRAAAENASNVQLICADLLDMPAQEDAVVGPFDFIVAHGLFSWVPDEVREALFATIRARLAPDGVAYVSYNTLPGWSVADNVAEVMRGTADGAKTPADRIGHARRSWDLISALMSDAQGPHVEMVNAELAQIASKPEGVVLHDELEAVSDPCYFLQFVGWAAEHGLHYVTDPQLPTLWPQALSASVRQALLEHQVPRLQMEQYLDYRDWRRFRRSILCHVERQPEERPDPQQLDSLYLDTFLRLAGPLAFAPGLPVHYGLVGMPAGQSVLTVTDPFAQKFLQIYAELHDKAEDVILTIGQLIDRARGQVSESESGQNAETGLRSMILNAVARQWANLGTAPVARSQP